MIKIPLRHRIRIREYWPHVLGVSGVISIVLVSLMIPHWMRTTGEIAGKDFKAAWIEHHSEYISYSSGWTEERGTKKHPVYIYHEGHYSYHPAWDEHHPAYYWLIMKDGSQCGVDVSTWASADAGDWMGADGFYGTKLVKTKGPE